MSDLKTEETTPLRSHREKLETLGPQRAKRLWAGTRVLLILTLLVIEPSNLTDIHYYYTQLSEVSSPLQLDGVMPEYPIPILVILALPMLLSGGVYWLYVSIFILMMLALDALMSRALWRLRSRLPFLVWTFGLLLLGPIVYARYDMIPAVLVGFALLAMVNRRYGGMKGERPALSGALLAAGIAVKLWPVALVPAFLARKAATKKFIIGMAAVGAGLLAISIPFGGFDRLLAPFTHQEGRGLQVESVWATPAMLTNSLAGAPYRLGVIHHAWEIKGPGTVALTSAATLSILLAGVFILVLCGRAFVQKVDGVAPLLTVTIVMLIIVTNKVFSPQYLLWLIAPVAVLAADERRSSRMVAYHLGGILLLTHLVFPYFYSSILERSTSVLGMIGNTLLAARNMWIVGLAIMVCWWAWREVGVRARFAALKLDLPELARN